MFHRRINRTTMPNLPKINLLYYKNILDRCVKRFFEDNSSGFLKTDDGKYILSSVWRKQKLKKAFLGYIVDELKKYLEPGNEDIFLIIGSCLPRRNMFLYTLDMSWKGGFPQKYRRLLDEEPTVTYFLKEDDIVVDLVLFNDVFYNIFADFMKYPNKQSKKFFGGRKVLFVESCEMDCYAMFKTLKEYYGKLVVNLHKKYNLGEDQCIWSLNEKIDEYSYNKLEFLKKTMVNYKKAFIEFVVDMIRSFDYGS